MIRTSTAIKLPQQDGEFARALLHGLQETPKRIASKYFYDADGSALFDEICKLPEYYPTRTEFALLRRFAPDMAAMFGSDVEIVEFGAGAAEKIRPLLDAADCPRAYLPVDISADYLGAVAATLRRDYPAIAVRPVAADFTGAFVLPARVTGAERRIGFFPGSTIGNFTRPEAKQFLSKLAKMLDGLLIGVDLVKDPAILHAAYNDSAGVTASFNKNLLVRANREADANFDPARFHHYALYNPIEHRMEMYLVSSIRQRVRVAGETIDFDEGEAIHTEWSYKYTVDDFRALGAEAGFKPRNIWCDDARLLSLHWLEV